MRRLLKERAFGVTWRLWRHLVPTSAAEQTTETPRHMLFQDAERMCCCRLHRVLQKNLALLFPQISNKPRAEKAVDNSAEPIWSHN